MNAKAQGRGHIRQKILKVNFAPQIDLTGKTVIVTGATHGSLGYATAWQMASRGANVVITARHDVEQVVDRLRKSLSQTHAKSLQGFKMDLCDATSVSHFVAQFLQQYDRLDILINNAGIHQDILSKWKEPSLSADGYEIHWRTNYLGTVHLTELLLPALLTTAQKTGDARVVNVVSHLHTKGNNHAMFNGSQPYNSWVAYGSSKLALVHYTQSLQEKYAAQGLHAYCLHPGAVYTNIANSSFNITGFWRKFRQLTDPMQKFFLFTPHEGAQTSVYCAIVPNLSGLYYKNCESHEVSQDAKDANARAQLWTVTQKWLGQVVSQLSSNI